MFEIEDPKLKARLDRVLEHSEKFYHEANPDKEVFPKDTVIEISSMFLSKFLSAVPAAKAQGVTLEEIIDFTMTRAEINHPELLEKDV